MNGFILLSICIPTYNRSMFLKNCIESIICQQEFKNGDVEIVVSDNASSDNTKELCESYKKQFTNFIYSRNDVNIKDCNFPTALSKGHGILRRLITDTEVFRKGSLRIICDIVKDNLQDRPVLVWENVDRKELVTSTDFHGYITQMGFRITAIDCHSFWEDYCLDILDDTSGIETFLWQLKKGLEVAQHTGKIKIIHKKLFDKKKVLGKDISYGVFNVFHDNYLELLKQYYQSGVVNDEDMFKIEKDLLFSYFMAVLVIMKTDGKAFSVPKADDLYDSVCSAYRDKDYWMWFKVKYWLNIEKHRVKQLLEKVFGSNDIGF